MLINGDRSTLVAGPDNVGQLDQMRDIARHEVIDADIFSLIAEKVSSANGLVYISRGEVLPLRPCRAGSQSSGTRHRYSCEIRPIRIVPMLMGPLRTLDQGFCLAVAV